VLHHAPGSVVELADGRVGTVCAVHDAGDGTMLEVECDRAVVFVLHEGVRSTGDDLLRRIRT